MRSLEENKIVVIVGIPGVGKTTLISRIVEILKEKQTNVSVYSFGTVMLEEAKNAGIADRDELRKLSVDRQKHFQTMAATKIALKKNDVVIVDTHAFINTSEGFYPGLPIHVIEHLKPTNFISISARPEEIYNRRMKDTSRNRDVISLASIKKELAVQDAMLSSCSVLSGSPMKPVLNREGKIDEAAMKVIKAMGI